jgi:hypothetical protein|tara:strand:+ start:294 stop:602 length:309 start_codon:yes stop_codon:yes gene_type:complete
VETGNSENDAEKIRKVFRWLFLGWSAFFVLVWFINHDLKFLIEIAASVFMGGIAAGISTLIYWGIREFLKAKTGSGQRVEAAESEIAELRRKVEELSRSSED